MTKQENPMAHRAVEILIKAQRKKSNDKIAKYYVVRIRQRNIY